MSIVISIFMNFCIIATFAFCVCSIHGALDETITRNKKEKISNIVLAIITGAAEIGFIILDGIETNDNKVIKDYINGKYEIRIDEHIVNGVVESSDTTFVYKGE